MENGDSIESYSVCSLCVCVIQELYFIQYIRKVGSSNYFRFLSSISFSIECKGTDWSVKYLLKGKNGSLKGHCHSLSRMQLLFLYYCAIS